MKQEQLNVRQESRVKALIEPGNTVTPHQVKNLLFIMSVDPYNPNRLILKLCKRKI